MMDVAEAVRKRKSVRAYEERPVPDEMVRTIVEAGQWAPNGGPFQITVVRNAALRKKINDRTLEALKSADSAFARQRAALPGYQPLYGAPVLILLSAPLDLPSSPVNTALAAENMILEATGLGLGSCYLWSPTRALNGEANRDLAKEAGVPEGYTLNCAVIIGYGAAEDGFSPPARVKKGKVDYID